MLIQIRIENHRSLRDEQILSFVAADDAREDAPAFQVAGLDEALLPAVALYGANASGKSNVLGALGFMRRAVVLSHRGWEPDGGTPNEPFALSDKVDQPSTYEVDIIVEAARYRYGFLLSTDRVEEEWLFACSSSGLRPLFERKGDHFAFDPSLPGENETIRALTRPNSLFLSAAAQNNHPWLEKIFAWFRRVTVERTQGQSRYGRRPFWAEFWGEESERPHQNRNALVTFLRAADTGIVDFKVERSEKQVPGPRGTPVAAARPTVSFRHRGADNEERSWLPLEAESSGTNRMLEIATLLVPVLEHGGLLCIDELEASLHPMLALEVVRTFYDPIRNPKQAQLLFTTHDTNLLGNTPSEPLLRRDQVWFTEKDEEGATHLYPLTDFHVRGAENVERGYLQGRYGAIPFLGKLVNPPDGSDEGK